MIRVAVLVLAACSTVDPPPDRLSEMNLFDYQGDGVFVWSDGIVPYELNTPLFSDHALKARAMALPAGVAAGYEPEQTFDFPGGTTLIKSFLFPADLREPDQDVRLVETRLLIRDEHGWTGWPYIWDEDESDAYLDPNGDRTVPVELIDEDGQTLEFIYDVPSRQMCMACHAKLEQGRVMTPIGTKARHLERDVVIDGTTVGQLDHLAEIGFLEGLPEDVPAAYDFRDVEARGVDALTPDETERAARDWLDVNCAHCHAPDAPVGQEVGLDLRHDNTDESTLGICRRAEIAGAVASFRTFDIVPGDHDASVVWYRMSTMDDRAIMPLIGRHTECPTCSDLVARWIDELPGDCN